MYNNDDFIYYNVMPYSNMMNSDLSENTTSLFDPYNSLIRGNSFKKLYSPYFKEEPFQLKPKNNQDKELYNLMAIDFMTTDLNLYLDVNPDDKQMINLFNKYKNECNRLTSEYEKKYGPINLSSNELNTYPWSWNKSNWPWEVEK